MDTTRDLNIQREESIYMNRGGRTKKQKNLGPRPCYSVAIMQQLRLQFSQVDVYQSRRESQNHTTDHTSAEQKQQQQSQQQLQLHSQHFPSSAMPHTCHRHYVHSSSSSFFLYQIFPKRLEIDRHTHRTRQMLSCLIAAAAVVVVAAAAVATPHCPVHKLHFVLSMLLLL